MTQLTPQECERVRQEEVYRSEVRRQLTAKDDNRKGFLPFLNSNFGLWLLSAIFISGAGSVYQSCQKSRASENAALQQKLEADSKRAQLVDRLDDEISFRLSQGLIELSALANPQQGKDANSTHGSRANHTARPAARILISLAAAPRGSAETASAAGTSGARTLYPEFSEYSLPTLMGLLRRSLPPDEAKDDLARSLAALAALGRDQEDLTLTPKEAASKLLSSVVLNRWRSTRFYYIDCPAEQPFC